MEYTLQPSPRQRTSRNVFPGGVEDEWTPEITFATPGDLSVLYTQRFGYFVRFGSFATCYFNLATLAFTHTTASGVLRLFNIPFKPRRAATGAFGFSTGGLVWRGITKANYTDMFPDPVVGQNYLQFTLSGSGQTPAFVTAADMPTGGTVNFRGGVTFQLEEVS